jgi:hypothetical protein
LQGSKIAIESRDEIVRRIGRSPDMASAFILAALETPKYIRKGQLMVPKGQGFEEVLDRNRKEYDPYSNM